MRVLVTGGLGFIGRAVTRRLVEAGHEVVVVSRRAGVAERRLVGPATLVQADIGDRVRMGRLVRYHDFDGVCHLAALTGDAESRAQPLRYYDTNLGGTLNLLSVLDRHARSTGRPARLVFASTGAVYGDPSVSPVPEDAPTVPISPYGASKLAAEQAIGHLARTGTLGAVVIRHFNAAGAIGDISDTDVRHLIPEALAVVTGTEPAFRMAGDGAAVGEFTHIADLAEAFRLGLEHATAGVTHTYNVGSGAGVSVRQVLDTVEEVAGRAVAVERRAPHARRLALVADSTRAHRELHWAARHSSIEQIVQDAWRAARRPLAHHRAP